MTTRFKAYFVECITNMHAGSGDANYGIVDKLVQRDVLTNLPTVHASSLKGALREHFEQKWGYNDSNIENIFGKEEKNSGSSETGRYKFLSADLIAIPVRCNYKSYVLGLSKQVVNEANLKSELLVNKALFSTIANENNLYTDENATSVFAEDTMLTIQAYSNPMNGITTTYNGFGDRYASFDQAAFENISKNLPVIARNQLSKGVSKNLWYEEVVPHKTLFITYIGVPQNQSDQVSAFETDLVKDIIQVGGNATVGYGLCKFHAITF